MMSNQSQTHSVNSSTKPVVAPLLQASSRVQFVTMTLLGSVLLAASAQVQVPLLPVPMTMQPFALMVLGLVCHWRLAMTITMTYLLEGAAGLPVFAGFTSGIAITHTMGYLLGFVPQVVLISLLAQRCIGKPYELLRQIGALLAGQAVLYCCGVAWLASLVGLKTALLVGVVPFLPMVPVKMFFALAVARSCRRS
ncbi:MAG: biotin transporter BioY [Myxococcota bacterium]